MTDKNAREAGRLLRVLGVGFGIAVLVGNTIGSGILRNPGDVAARVPDPAIFIALWIAGGVYALLGSNAVAEVAAMTHESGGYTVFARRGLGPYAGFVAGWSDWLSTCSSLAAGAILIGEYSSVLLHLKSMTTAIACVTIAGFTILQWRGIRSAVRTQNITSVLKALAFAAFIVVCFAWPQHAPSPTSTPAAPAGKALVIAILLSMQAIIFTYDGWIGPAYFGGEVKDPGREMPRSIFGGVFIVIAIYVLLNLGLLHVLPIGVIAGSDFAAGTAASALFGSAGDMILRSLIVLSLLSAMNAFLLMATRAIYGFSVVTTFSSARSVSESGTPTTALALSSLVALAFAISGTYQMIIAITAFFFVANYTLLYLSLFALRIREPAAMRPYRALGHPWTTGFVLLVSIAFLAGALITDTRNSIYSLIMLVISVPIYRRFRLRTVAPASDKSVEYQDSASSSLVS